MVLSVGKILDNLIKNECEFALKLDVNNFLVCVTDRIP